MAAHAPIHDDRPESALGAVLLPIFAVALIPAVVVISLVIALPGMVTLIAAMATVIAFTAGIVAILGRLIRPEEH